MYYLGVEQVEINIDRIATRVKNGGHHIPTEDVLRRKERSTSHLLEIIDFIDYAYIIDNTSYDAKIVIEIENGRFVFINDNLPIWVQHLLKMIRK